ncbi:MAG: transaldolase [Pseudonocardiales bacterium]|nr:transaldolase [Pseudonocardiales bacterium]MBV9030747.1 transaldolase [Pseudonocardiales bacterium]
MGSTDTLAALSEAGVSIWLDDLSRQRVNSGNLANLITERHVVGVTSNPTIFAHAVVHAEDYADQVKELAARSASVDDAVREITVTDVQLACDVFSGTWETTAGVDGRVSLEVDPRLAHHTDATLTQAAELWKVVDRPNLMIKIPATAEGLTAITGALADGISVNVTLVFSVQRYREVMAAFFAGLEQARANGHPLAGIASVASFFVSRMDTEVDKRLEAIGTEAALALRGQAAVANARLAYAAYQQEFATRRWAQLKEAGARPQRPLWASTGVKNPAYPDTKYVTELIAPGVVNTMPENTLLALADHGEVPGDRVSGTAQQSQRTFDELAEVGIDLEDVLDVLEREGVQKFDASWAELGETVAAQLAKTAPDAEG